MSQHSGKHQETEVTCFTVCRDTLQDGKRLIHDPLSVSYSSKEEADIMLNDLREHYPDAYVVQSTPY